jgi:hypothetical protein
VTTRPIDAAKVTRLLQPLVGQYLAQLGVGVGQLQMHFKDGDSVSIGNRIRVNSGPAVEAHQLDGLRLLLPLLNHDLTRASADERGGLWLHFGDVAVGCDADEQYEAWNYSGPEGSLVVSMPGGGFAIWSSR